ncbi:uncharacterized protein LOC133323073 [Musca vetustissima]|uniref:uncharacterized protein LOC133323073 n=1 Tax=Musca vetustissima TaxID=27455 RepID=UPI002AB6ADE2|nr:uncharacterized protein LOC133323073 [Musca vetustissima]
MSKKFLIILFVIYYFYVVKVAKRTFKLQFFSYDCINITSHVQVFDCVFEKEANNRFIFSERLMLTRDMNRNFEMHLWIRVKPLLAKKPLQFLDVKFNVCEFLDQPLQVQLLRGLLIELFRSSNIPLMCPFKGNFLYQMINFSFTDAYFPPYTPALNFTFQMEFFDKKTMFAITRISGDITPLR